MIRPLATAVVIGLACANDLRAATGAVVVTDFEIPAAESNAWGWARVGLADLLQQALSTRGAPTVDREYLHAVTFEQRLTAGGGDPFQAGGLLGAQLIVGGRLTPIDAEKVRIDAWLSTVEQLEKLTSVSAEGPWRTGLMGLLDQLAGGLIAGQLPVSTTGRPAGLAIRPEALKMLYEGIDACARQQPALAIGYFLNAQGFDPRLEEARQWEVRAYQMAGLHDHARLLSAHYAAAARSNAVTAASSGPATADARRVVAVLPPFSGDTPASGESTPATAELRRRIEQALRDDERVRVSGYEGLMHAVAEQDAQLSGLMSPSTCSRYGGWLMADALLRSRIDGQTGGVVRLDLQIVAPATGRVLARVEERLSTESPRAGIGRAVARLVGDWLAARAGSTNAAEDQVSPALTDEELLRLPAHRILAGAVDKLYVHPMPLASRPFLVHAYLNAGEPPLAEMEFEKFATAIDTSAGNAARKALRFYSEHVVPFDLRHQKGARPFLPHIPDSIQLRLIREVIAGHPDDFETGCLVFMLLADAWWTERWPTAVSYGQASVEYFDHLASWRQDWRLRPLIPNYYHMYGHALLQVGRYKEALEQLKKAAAFDCDEAWKTVQFPRHGLSDTSFGAVVESNWVNQCDGFPALGAMPDLKAALRDDLARAEAGRGELPPLPIAEDRPASPAVARSTIEEIERLIRMCEELPAPPDGTTFVLPGEIVSALYHADDTALRPQFPSVLRRLSEVTLRRGGVSRDRIGAKMFSEDSWWFATRVAEYYEIAARKNPALIGRSWEVLGPLAHAPYPTDLGYDILSLTPCGLADCASMVEAFKGRMPHMTPREEAVIWVNIGRTEWQKRALDGAISCFRKARLLDPAADHSPPLVEVALSNRPDDPATEVARLRGLWFSPPLPQPQLWEWFNAARDMQATGRWTCAIACYEGALSVVPDFDPSYGGRLKGGGFRGFNRRDLATCIRFYLAECLAKAGRADEAVRLYREVAAERGDADCNQVLSMVPFAGERGRIGGAQTTVKLGILAAERAAQLHEAAARP